GAPLTRLPGLRGAVAREAESWPIRLRRVVGPYLAHQVVIRQIAPSSSSVVSCGVEVLELDAGVLGREPPVDPTTGSVARRLPGRGLPLQGRPVAQAPV